MLSGGNVPEVRVVFSENGLYGQSFMARKGNCKVNYYPQTREFDMFDLSTDPDELQNCGRGVTWETLPDWARITFARLLADSEYLRGRSYQYDGKIFPLFTRAVTRNLEQDGGWKP